MITWQLSRLARWHVSEGMNQALAMVVAAQGKLPMSRFWGMGKTASSDGQFFPSARQGEAMNMISAKYGSEPGLKACTSMTSSRRSPHRLFPQPSVKLRTSSMAC